MVRACFQVIMTVILFSGGCVMINPGEMHVGSPSPRTIASPEAGTAETPWAKTLRHVMKQEDKVLKEIRKGEWSDASDEAGEWVEYVRALSGYAGASNDRRKFSAYCDDLARATQAVRDETRYQNANRCEQAVRACDPILNAFNRDFPMTAVVSPTIQSSTAPMPSTTSPPARVP